MERKRFVSKIGYRLHSLTEDNVTKSHSTAYSIANRVIKKIDAYPDDLLHLIDECSLRTDEKGLQIISKVIRGPHSEEFLRDLLMYLPLMDTGRHWVEGMMMSLQLYKKYPWIPREPDEEQRKSVARFLIATYAVVYGAIAIIGEPEYENEEDRERYSNDGTLELTNPFGFGADHWVLTDERTARYIFDNPDDENLILDTVNDRGTLDYDVIHPVLTHSESALNHGVL